MDATWKESIWDQLGAAIDTLENAIRACPDELWRDRTRRPEYWYLAFHTLFFLDYYLSESPDGFAPPAPFTLDELDPEGVLPTEPYGKDELLAYLEHGRAKARAQIAGLSEAEAARRCAFKPEVTVAGLLLYNLRHVQHHAAQLNLLLRQNAGSAPGWVSGSTSPLLAPGSS